MNKAIKVLDHGLVRLVDSMGSDVSVVRSARISYNAAWTAGEDEGSDAKLINYLFRNNHNTPFESIEFQFEIKAPIFVFRQWHRHRTQSYNEISARYKELPEEYYVPEGHLIGTQALDNKQCRNILTPQEYNELSTVDKLDINICRAIIDTQNNSSFRKYKILLGKGVPRELARSVLPVGTYSHMFAKMNLHNLFGFLRERLHPHAQYEIRMYAEAILQIIKPIAPVCVSAFEKSMRQ